MDSIRTNATVSAAGEFWEFLDKLVAQTKIVVDRPKGSAHPRYLDAIYPMDYGYLEGSRSADGAGIDVWLGTVPSTRVQAVLCSVDLVKSDAELKLLMGCSSAEVEAAVDFCNRACMRSLLVERPRDARYGRTDGNAVIAGKAQDIL